MVFSSYLFLFCFLPIALGLYYVLPLRWKNLGLTVLSYIFYGWSNPWFVFVMLFSTVANYVCGLYMGGRIADGGLLFGERSSRDKHLRTKTQKAALIVSVLANLLPLGFFKYFNFGLENYNDLITLLHLDVLKWDTVMKVTLPLGISFYTFQAMSYTIDVYRGRAYPLTNFVDFACFVSMFSQLVAGPIIRFGEVKHQLRRRAHTLQKFALGVGFFSLGMAKKVLLANPCGKIADTVFDAGTANALDSWYGVCAYAFQIYFDFSGYSDMAIGLGVCFGFVFPKNFDSPYRSQSITEFWRRWHMSLSRWFKDYLYIFALGGNRRGKRRTYVNLMLVMLLGGLWHGASWNFVLWGGLHGGILAVERLKGKSSIYHGLPKPIRITITFLLVLVGWVFFRAPDLARSWIYLKNMFGFGDPQAGADLIAGIIYQPYYLLCFVVSAVVIWCCPQVWDWIRRMSWAKLTVAILLLWASIIAMTTQSYNPFIYFIF